MRLKKRFAGVVSVVVAFAIVLGMLPIIGRPLEVYAESANKSIACLGTEAMTNPLVPTSMFDHWAGSFVYLGKYNGNPVKYRVLDPDTTRFGSRTMLLDCHDVLYEKQYNPVLFGLWDDSALYKELNTNSDSLLNTCFTQVERNAIAESRIPSHELTSDSTEEGAVNVEEYFKEVLKVYTPLNGDKLFFLDLEDASNNAYGYEAREGFSLSRLKSDNKSWWLRNKDLRPETKREERYGAVDEMKWFGTFWYINPNGVSPALNLSLNKTVFSSVVSGTAGQTNAEYKLTLVDPDMSISMDKGVKKDGSLVTVPYCITNNSQVASPNQVSAVVTDGTWTENGWSEGANVLQYAKLDMDYFSQSGTGHFTLDDSITGEWGKDYHVYILAEDVRAGVESDYASEPIEVKTIELKTKGYEDTYDRKEHDISVYATYPETGATIKYGTVKGEYTLDYSPVRKDVGEETVYYRVTAPNCLEVKGSEKIKINKKELMIIADTKRILYGDPLPELTYMSSGLIEGDKITGSLSKSGSMNAGISFINQGTLSAGNNYEINFIGAFFYISPVDAIIDKAPEKVEGLVYDGEEHELVTPGIGIGGQMEYALGDDEETAPTDGKFTCGIPVEKSSGTYYVWYKMHGDINHVDTKPVCIPVTISKAEVKLSWTDTILAYNGELQAPKVEVSNKAEGDDVNVTVTGGEKNVGVHTATASELTGADAFNYYMPEDVNHIYNILKATPELDVSIEDWTYGDFVKEPKVTGVPEGEEVIIEFKPYGAKKSTYSQTAPTEAGIYNIRATVKGDGNYVAASVEDSFTIRPKEVGLEWGDTAFSYDGTDKCPDAGVSGLEEADEGKVEADVIGASATVGDHVARVIALTGDAASNYKLPADSKVTFKIIPAADKDEGEEQDEKGKDDPEKKDQEKKEEEEKKEEKEQKKQEKKEEGKKEEEKKEEKKETGEGVGSWKQDSDGWWYEYTNGDYPKNEWKQIDGEWYYFREDGYMAADEWCDGWWCDSDGVCRYIGQAAWKSDASGWWYGDTTGWYAKSQWQRIDNIWYYFGADGYLLVTLL